MLLLLLVLVADDSKVIIGAVNQLLVLSQDFSSLLARMKSIHESLQLRLLENDRWPGYCKYQ